MCSIGLALEEMRDSWQCSRILCAESYCCVFKVLIFLITTNLIVESLKNIKGSTGIQKGNADLESQS